MLSLSAMSISKKIPPLRGAVSGLMLSFSTTARAPVQKD
jgi:hypothetical protein